MVVAACSGFVLGWVVGPWARRAGAHLPRWVIAFGGAAAAALPTLAAHSLQLLVPGAAVAFGLWIVAAIDLHSYRIPNALVLAIAAVGTATQALGVGFARPLPCLLAAAAAGGAFALLTVVSRGGFGWGDAKLAAALAWVLGPAAGATALLVTVLAGGVGAGLLLLTGRRALRDPVPFAPFFLFGGLWALLAMPRG